MNKRNKLYTTPSQTVGPFYGNYLKFNNKQFPFIYNYNKNSETSNVTIICKIKNKNNAILEDCFIEYWQAEKRSNNKFIFFNFNRVKFSKKNKCYLININQKKSLTNIYLILFGRGILNHLYIKIYLEDDLKFYSDELFNNILNNRKKSIIAKLKKVSKKNKVYEFDIYLNGDNETVFFNAMEQTIYDN